jgi:hypothetical protein
METTPIRVWDGVYGAIQIYAKKQGMDASTLASIELMRVLFTEENLPKEAQTALARDFFQILGEGIASKKNELADWAVNLVGGKSG